MDRKEALEFLELPEFAAPDEIKAKLESKLAYYEMLSEKAPSAFVRRLHTRNVARVKDIMQASKSWPPAVAPAETGFVQVPEMIEDAGPSLAVAEPEPVVDQPAAVVVERPVVREQVVEKPVVREQAAVVAKQEPAALPGKPASRAPEPVGWLIRHTENQSAVTYPIYPGKNYIGRKEKSGFSPFIKVEEDPYISKIHAVVIAEAGRTFFVADDLASNGDKPSTNGTYLNGREDRVAAKTRLANNDTIQIGITKLMFRYNDNAIEDILDEVAGKDYMHTVVIYGL